MNIPRLHVITDETVQGRHSHVDLARLALAGGADAVQFREKRSRTTRELLGVAREIAQACGQANAVAIVNDRVDVALDANAHGLHIGRDDLDVATARRILGRAMLIGGTANSYDEAMAVAATDVDYLGVGPVYGTRSKTNPAPVMGLEVLARIARNAPRPVIAIGGITARRIPETMQAGVHGVAVLSDIVAAEDPAGATRACRAAVDGWTAQTVVAPAAHEPPRLHVIADLGYMGGVDPWLDLLRKLNEAAARHRFIVQVRATALTGAEFATAARQARQAIGGQALLVLNGPTAIAADLGYDGVHWPESRIPSDPADPPLAIRSAAVHCVAAIRKAHGASATALLFSPVFPPRWKSVEAAGVDALRRAARSTALPVYALGGVSVDRVPACLDAGAHGVATVSGVATEDPAGAVAEYLAVTG